MKKADIERLNILHTMPCIACDDFPVVVHHCVNQEHKKRDHQRTIPLCPACHVGAFSIHMSRKRFRETYGHEEDLLKQTNLNLEYWEVFG